MTHRVRWFARFPGTDEDWTPRTRSMRGSWPWDVKCSCGWETSTGGAVESYIRREVWMHRFTAEDDVTTVTLCSDNGEA